MRSVSSLLSQVLVISARKGFWASPACEVFPNRIYSRRILPLPGRLGSSRNPLNHLTAALHGYLYFLRHKPKLIFIGSASRIAPWFANFKKYGWLPGAELVVSSQSYCSDDQVRYIARVIVYCSSEITTHPLDLQSHYQFMLLPADGPVDRYRNTPAGDFIFAGGGAGRDFASLIEAVRGTHFSLKIITFSPKTLNFLGQIPDNVHLAWRTPIDQFIGQMAGAKFVVIPLVPGLLPHGHTTVVQALSLGKALISTAAASVDDYITHGREGLLVPAFDIHGYRHALEELFENDTLRRSCEKNAHQKNSLLSYPSYSKQLVDLCLHLLST